jgi:hypothetical protein
LRRSHNITSATDNNTGDYTFNLTTALSDANYTITTGGQNIIGDGSFGRLVSVTQTPATTAFRVQCFLTSTLAAADIDSAMVNVFGDM